MGQELSNIVGRDIAIAIQGKDLEKNLTSLDGLSNVASILGTTFLRTMQGMALVGFPGSAYILQRDITRSNQASQDEIFFTKFLKSSKKKKLKERNPGFYIFFSQ